MLTSSMMKWCSKLNNCIGIPGGTLIVDCRGSHTRSARGMFQPLQYRKWDWWLFLLTDLLPILQSERWKHPDNSLLPRGILFFLAKCTRCHIIMYMKKISEYQIRHIRYKMIEQLTGKDLNTIKIFFSRNWMDIMEKQDILFYIQKYAIQ